MVIETREDHGIFRWSLVFLFFFAGDKVHEGD